MSESADLLVVIPAREEASTIGDVVRGAQRAGFRVLVIDDDSSDSTSLVAGREGAVVLSSPFNLGAWPATQAGIRYAADRGYSFVVTLDADGQHNPEYIADLIEHYGSSQRCNVVIASFPQRGSKMRRLAWAMFRRLGFFDIADPTSGFRLYDRKAVELLAKEAATLLEYQDVGVLLLLRENGLPVAELHIPMRQRQSGKSRIFKSWARVMYYMVYSMVLCVSKTSIRGSNRLYTRPDGKFR